MVKMVMEQRLWKSKRRSCMAALKQTCVYGFHCRFSPHWSECGLKRATKTMFSINASNTNDPNTETEREERHIHLSACRSACRAYCCPKIGNYNINPFIALLAEPNSFPGEIFMGGGWRFRGPVTNEGFSQGLKSADIVCETSVRKQLKPFDFVAKLWVNNWIMFRRWKWGIYLPADEKKKRL